MARAESFRKEPKPASSERVFPFARLKEKRQSLSGQGFSSASNRVIRFLSFLFRLFTTRGWDCFGKENGWPGCSGCPFSSPPSSGGFWVETECKVHEFTLCHFRPRGFPGWLAGWFQATCSALLSFRLQQPFVWVVCFDVFRFFKPSCCFQHQANALWRLACCCQLGFATQQQQQASAF